MDQDVTTEEVPDASEGEFQIPGSKRAIGPIPSFELLSQVRDMVSHQLVNAQRVVGIALL